MNWLSGEYAKILDPVAFGASVTTNSNCAPSGTAPYVTLLAATLFRRQRKSNRSPRIAADRIELLTVNNPFASHKRA